MFLILSLLRTIRKGAMATLFFSSRTAVTGRKLGEIVELGGSYEEIKAGIPSGGV